MRAITRLRQRVLLESFTCKQEEQFFPRIDHDVFFFFARFCSQRCSQRCSLLTAAHHTPQSSARNSLSLYPKRHQVRLSSSSVERRKTPARSLTQSRVPVRRWNSWTPALGLGKRTQQQHTMDSDRFLEPATSASSTASDSDQRPPRRRSTFEEDDSDSSHAEDARHDHRADLQRMMSRRTFAVADVGLRHRARSSMTGSAGAGAADVDGQHGRRASTVVASEANEVPPEDQPNANQVGDERAVLSSDATLGCLKNVDFRLRFA